MVSRWVGADSRRPPRPRSRWAGRGAPIDRFLSDGPTAGPRDHRPMESWRSEGARVQPERRMATHGPQRSKSHGPGKGLVDWVEEWSRKSIKWKLRVDRSINRPVRARIAGQSLPESSGGLAVAGQSRGCARGIRRRKSSNEFKICVGEGRACSFVHPISFFFLSFRTRAQRTQASNYLPTRLPNHPIHPLSTWR